MINSNYRKCLGYAFKADPVYYRDIVHDAYLVWYDKTTKDLFEEPNHIMIAVLGRIIKRWRYTKLMMQDGVYVGKIYIPVEEHPPYSKEDSPEAVLIAQDLHVELESLLDKNEKIIKKKLLQGFTYAEIINPKNELSPQLTSYYVIRARDRMTKKLKQVLSEQY